MTAAQTAPVGGFQERLRTGAEDFVWAVQQVPVQRRGLRPPRPSLGEWTAERHALHLVFYDEHIVVPTLRQWLGGPVVVDDDVSDEVEEAAFAQRPTLDDLLNRFHALRELQHALLAECATIAWDEPREAMWTRVMQTPVTARWILTKSLQHTAEHLHNVLSLALYWDVKRSSGA